MRNQHRPGALRATRRPPPARRQQCGCAALLNEPGAIADAPVRDESTPATQRRADGLKARRPRAGLMKSRRLKHWLDGTVLTAVLSAPTPSG